MSGLQRTIAISVFVLGAVAIVVTVVIVGTPAQEAYMVATGLGGAAAGALMPSSRKD
jgi:uncharacterized membrane protein